MVPAAAVARAIARFLEPGGTGKAARGRAQELAVKAHAAVAEGGSSCSGWARLVDELKALHGHGDDALTDKLWLKARSSKPSVVVGSIELDDADIADRADP